MGSEKKENDQIKNKMHREEDLEVIQDQILMVHFIMMNINMFSLICCS